jgi:PAS domain S-box-containing protein/putative nucleotidyltransferase with HDIG domain
VTEKRVTKADLLLEINNLRQKISELEQANANLEAMESALRKNHERLSALFDRSLDCVYELDFEGRVIDANPAALKLFGYDRADLTSLSIASLFYGDQLSKAAKRISEVIETGFQNELQEYMAKCKDGTYVDIETKTSIIYHEGKPHSILGVARDITERKKAEEELKRSFERVRKALGATVQAIAVMVETRDPYTAGHQRRVADLARSIATEMKLSSDLIDGLRTAGMIHDIGKIAVPAEILSKPTKLTALEFGLIKIHAQSGYDILKDIDFPSPIARMVLEHHERMDGSGYPNGLTGKDLLVESKILAVADVVEAIATHRPYRPGRGSEVAMEEITRGRGILYDSEVVEACVKLFRENRYKLES